MHEAFLGVRPRLFAHGQYYVDVVDETTVELPDATYETKIWSLSCDAVDGNLSDLDLATLDDTADDHV